MRNIFLKIATFTLFAWIGLFLFSGCGKTENPDLSYRVPRSFTEFPLPSNRIDSDKLPKVKDKGKLINIDNNILSMVNGDYRLDFVKKDNNYSLELVYIKDLPSTAPATPDRLMYANAFPAEVYIKSQTTENHFSGYREIVMKDYGFLAQAEFKTAAGSKITVLDHYYFPKESETGVFNIRKAVIVTEAKSADTGFESIYSIGSKGSGTYNWFVPNNIFLNFPSGLTSKVFRETQLGLPMMMMYNADTGYTVSLSRYQPIVNYIDNNFASLTAINSKAEAKIEIAYPSLDTSRKFHPISEGAQHVFDMSLCATRCEDYNTAMISAYNTHFNLQNQRIVDTDIYEVYRVVNEDYKTFLHSKAQKDEDTGKQYTSYGLPWRITIQDGEFGPLTYQAGFIGQQIPSAYQMMLYGIMNNDLKSLQNGLNVIDFWVIAAEFMSLAGVPRIWYDTWADGFREYPCFIRMAVDAMEGLLDAYRLAKAHNINRYEWYDAIEMFANFLVNNQNSDGSYYRCYNYDGGPFENWDNGIEEPPGNIAQSYRKDSTTMPVRFLGKMYELTGDAKYKEAALKAGEYVYQNLYPEGVYRGGTCDNPNRIDKEAGVFAMYCYDTLYTLTADDKWLSCLLQATAFTMSTVQVFSFPVKESDLKAAYPLYYGYNDGMSFITGNNNGLDNYIAFIYYELFRIYIITGDEIYLKQAELVQQNTKSIMNWDGTLGYKYKSLVAEASTIYNFTFSSASDGAWVTWSSVANIDPISKMLTNFGFADVAEAKKYDLATLRATLNTIGIGGGEHRTYDCSCLADIEK